MNLSVSTVLQLLGFGVDKLSQSDTVVKKLDSLVVIKGKTVPIGDIEGLLSAVSTALSMAGKNATVEDIAQTVGPDFLPVAEDIISLIIPYGGTALALAIWALEHSRKMTFAEEQAWMKRASDTAILSGG